jgi:hypothetical protein
LKFTHFTSPYYKKQHINERIPQIQRGSKKHLDKNAQAYKEFIEKRKEECYNGLQSKKPNGGHEDAAVTTYQRR